MTRQIIAGVTLIFCHFPDEVLFQTFTTVPALTAVVSGNLFVTAFVKGIPFIQQCRQSGPNSRFALGKFFILKKENLL